ncbi:MAG: hypothetical protein JO249_26535 [Acidobacteria bacterium]|nr:hypothetical protein [Acidobacteriota bacterium]
MAKNEHPEYGIVHIAPSQGWACDTCGKEFTFTDEEIEKLERPRPNTKPEDWDYYMPCPVCITGEIQQPTLSLGEALQSMFDCEE